MCTLMIINVHVYLSILLFNVCWLATKGEGELPMKSVTAIKCSKPTRKVKPAIFLKQLQRLSRLQYIWKSSLSTYSGGTNFDKNQRLLWDGHRISLQHRCIWPETIASQGAEFHSAAAQISLRRVVQWYGIIHWSKSTGWVPLRQSRSRDI